MNVFSHICVSNEEICKLESVNVGGKAKALATLGEAGFRVPEWFVTLPAAQDLPPDELASALRETVARHFALDERLAVRSSAADEDGARHSFAGQFESYLNVAPEEVLGRVTDVWRSVSSERVRAYCREHELAGETAAAVIVQRMVAAESAGVAFGIEPATGRRGVAVVSAVRGLGERLVSGEADADTWEVDRAGAVVSRRVVHDAPVLDDAQVVAVAALVRATGKHFGRPQDVEWAFDAAGTLWLLQSRPVTGLDRLPEADGAYALWDNSNIAESYGGITTPLTFSFARRAYEEVYRQFCRLMGVPEARIEANAGTFRGMLGLVRGRVYYHLVNWHRVLALLPGYRVNRGFMEGMMGVKEPLPPEAMAELARDSAGGAAPSAWARLTDGLALGRAVAGLVWNGWRLPRQIDAFYARLGEALKEPSPPLETWRADELAAHYRLLETQLLTRWDAPLVNDFFAMISFGVLRKLAAKWYGDTDGNLPNVLLAGTGGIVSAEPARLIRDMSRRITQMPQITQILQEGSTAEIERALPRWPEVAAEMQAYLERFGDRCLEELKLETPTLRDDPLALYRAVGRLAENKVQGSRNQEFKEDPGSKGEGKKEPELPGPAWKRAVFRWVTRQARERVRGRENLRFERTRVFGRTRRICVELGRRLHAGGRLAAPRDVFYLTLEEVLGFVDGTTVSADLRGLVAARRAEFDAYRREPAPADRFETRGAVHLGNAFVGTAVAGGGAGAAEENGELRRGLACCAGTVRGRARVVLDPRGAEVLPGEILVAQRTDPGWVLLFPAAAGLAVEHGSLLSHSAIVARELGLPAVVSVPGLTAWLRTGDLVEVDGAAGTVRRMKEEG